MARIEPMAEASLPDMRARSSHGIAMAAMMPMIATTISSSIRVNPCWRCASSLLPFLAWAGPALSWPHGRSNSDTRSDAAGSRAGVRSARRSSCAAGPRATRAGLTLRVGRTGAPSLVALRDSGARGQQARGARRHEQKSQEPAAIVNRTLARRALGPAAVERREDRRSRAYWIGRIGRRRRRRQPSPLRRGSRAAREDVLPHRADGVHRERAVARRPGWPRTAVA